MAALTKGSVLVTGLHGFTGSYLEGVLRKAGYRVFGLVSGAPRNTNEYQTDICDAAAVAQVVAAVVPDYIIHLAAVSFIAHEDIGQIYDVNVKGTLNLIGAIRKFGRPLRKLLVASSGNIYGASATSTSVTEETVPLPLNHYGISKLAAEYICRLENNHIPTIIVRPFNYTGIGQTANFVVPKLVAAFRNTKNEIRLGNIDTVRDFSDVRWISQIYLALLESDITTATLNICSGRGTCVRDVLNELAKIVGYKMHVETDEALLRETEIPILVGSTKKLESMIAVPQRPTLTETLTWMYADTI